MSGISVRDEDVSQLNYFITCGSSTYIIETFVKRKENN